MRRWLLALALATCAWAHPAAHAEILYTWEGTCTARWWESDTGRIPLPCPEVVRGRLVMPDYYVPGTAFDYTESINPHDRRANGWGFTLYDASEWDGTYEFCCGGWMGLLPAGEGPGSYFEGNPAPLGIRIDPEDWYFIVGFTHASGIVMTGSFSIFRRVPEPPSLALALAALLVVAVKARVVARRSGA
jgi:hypothetical protein